MALVEGPTVGGKARLQMEGCRLLADAALTPGGRATAIQTRQLYKMVVKMAEYPKHEGLQELSCRGLGNYAVGTEGQAAVLALKGPKLTCAAMAVHASSAPVQREACRALANISLHNSAGRVAVVLESGCELIVNALKTFADDAGVQEHGARALANISAETEGRRAAVHADGFAGLIPALTIHKPDVTVLEQTCAAMANLAADDDHAGRVAALAAGCVQPTVAVLYAHLPHEEILVHMCRFVANFVEKNTECRDAAITGETAKRLSVILAAPPRDVGEDAPDMAPTFEQACRALAGIAATLRGRKACVSAAGPSAIKKALKLYAGHASLCEQACSALALMAVGYEEGQDNIARNGGPDVAFVSITKHMSHPGVVENGLRALATIAFENEDTVKSMLALGGVGLALQCKETYPDNPTIQGRAADLLFNLEFKGKPVKTIGQSDAPKRKW